MTKQGVFLPLPSFETLFLKQLQKKTLHNYTKHYIQYLIFI